MERMIVARSLALSAVLPVGCLLPATAAPMLEREALLRWRGNSGMIAVELVRGDVQVLREARSDIVLEAFSSGPSITMEMVRTGDGWLLRDAYPDRPVRQVPRECLPPGHAGVGRVTVRAPPTATVGVCVSSGCNFDLHSKAIDVPFGRSPMDA